MEAGTLCATMERSAADWSVPEGALVLEHQPISFPSYPYEWSPGMLAAAGELTLDLAEQALSGGYYLKDATPYNILFEDARPVFVDLLSFDERDPTDALWRPYAQFVRTFVYPLLLNRYFGLRLDETLTTHRDGLEPERVWDLCPRWRLALPPFLGAVTLPALLDGGDHGTRRGYQARRARNAEEAGYILSRLFRRARKLLAVGPPCRRTAIGRYMDDVCRYSPEEIALKEGAVREAFAAFRPRTALDVGCNAGHFSNIAADAGARVIAIDKDAGVADELWREASARRRPILPLVIDFGRPSAAQGWENGECLSFLERATGAFDCVMMLALVHHLIVNERAPLGRIFSLAAKLTRDLALLEYVDPADEQFQRIARGRESLHADLTQFSFEKAAAERFEIAASVTITPTRRIYTLQKKTD